MPVTTFKLTVSEKATWGTWLPDIFLHSNFQTHIHCTVVEVVYILNVTLRLRYVFVCLSCAALTVRH